MVRLGHACHGLCAHAAPDGLGADLIAPARGSVYANILAQANIPGIQIIQFGDDSATLNALVAGQVVDANATPATGDNDPLSQAAGGGRPPRMTALGTANAAF
jgi:ABC-type nitrate/sulfonate/bicarbonate transport system substrate-binding protein